MVFGKQSQLLPLAIAIELKPLNISLTNKIKVLMFLIRISQIVQTIEAGALGNCRMHLFNDYIY